jgi:kumamolisin
LGGGDNEIGYIQQQVTIPSSTPYLVYWQWIESYDTCGFDFGYVLINSSAVDTYDLCSTTSTGGWVTHSVNLSAYAGQSVTLQIRATTDLSEWSNLYVDDVSLQASAAATAGINGFAPNLGAATHGKSGILIPGRKP